MDNKFSIGAVLSAAAIATLITLIIISVALWLVARSFFKKNRTLIDALNASQKLANNRSQMLNEEKILSQLLKNSNDKSINSKKTKSKQV